MPRKPMPRAIRILEGNRQKRKIPPSVDVPAEMPDCPDHLDATAKDEWQRIAPQLLELGVLGRIDRAALAQYCQSYSRWVHAEKRLRRTGMIDREGKLNPLVRVINDAWDQMRRALVEFGMTPSSRARLRGNGDAKKADPLEAFLSGAG